MRAHAPLQLPCSCRRGTLLCVSVIQAQAQNPEFLGVFDANDMSTLCEHLSFLAFDKDDIIMMRGEVATWMGIVLQGKLEASVGDKTVGVMSEGSIVGEVAFFAGHMPRGVCGPPHTAHDT